MGAFSPFKGAMLGISYLFDFGIWLFFLKGLFSKVLFGSRLKGLSLAKSCLAKSCLYPAQIGHSGIRFAAKKGEQIKKIKIPGLGFGGLSISESESARNFMDKCVDEKFSVNFSDFPPPAGFWPDLREGLKKMTFV